MYYLEAGLPERLSSLAISGRRRLFNHTYMLATWHFPVVSATREHHRVSRDVNSVRGFQLIKVSESLEPLRYTGINSAYSQRLLLQKSIRLLQPLYVQT